ncbi:MAG: response regulator [Bacteroidetes bacterium]|nr:response regulator [Bacteroidota bacterium]
MKKINCILLIDDNTADNEFHTLTIKEANVCNHIQVALNAIEGLNYIKNQSELLPKPDLIYLDINMPGMSGFDFLAEYAKLDKKLKSKVVIIMLSTSLNPDDRKRANEIDEVTEFQNKPLTVEITQKTIEKYF